jgi:hypothetical protein
VRYLNASASPGRARARAIEGGDGVFFKG